MQQQKTYHGSKHRAATPQNLRQIPKISIFEARDAFSRPSCLFMFGIYVNFWDGLPRTWIHEIPELGCAKWQTWKSFFRGQTHLWWGKPLQTKIDQSQKGKKTTRKPLVSPATFFTPLPFRMELPFEKKYQQQLSFFFVLKKAAALFGQPLVLLKYSVRSFMFFGT